MDPLRTWLAKDYFKTFPENSLRRVIIIIVIACWKIWENSLSFFFFSEHDFEDGSKTKSSIVRLSSIKQIMSHGKHALLDVTPNAVDKLNYAQLYPIVIFAKAESKQTIKDCRAGLPKKAHMPSKKLLEQSQKLDSLWSYIFTATFDLTNMTTEAIWYSKITDTIDKQQTAPIWMSEAKVMHFSLAI